jgi:hypothetical protein
MKRNRKTISQNSQTALDSASVAKDTRVENSLSKKLMKIAEDPKLAFAFLLKAGIITKLGSLTKHYK